MTTSERTSSRLPVWLIVGFVVFVLGAFVVALVVSGGDDAATDVEGDGAEVAPVEVVGTALEPMPQGVGITDAGNDPPVGMVAPTIRGTDFSGQSVELAPGTPKVVMFLAHWCRHCQREVPTVVDMIEQGKLPEGLEIYGISTAVRDGESNYPPSAWFEAENWSEPSIRDSAQNEILLAYGAGGFPYVVYLDGENTVIGRSSGELDEATIEQMWLATADS
jgi:cytochrome c biogenesis protein CcmG/thiol:disulfide interchange protein DsbE